MILDRSVVMLIIRLLTIGLMTLFCAHCASNYSTQETLDGKFLGNPESYKKYLPLVISPKTPSININQSVTLTATGGSSGYIFRIVSGKGAIAQSGVYSAADIPGNVTIEVKDSVGTIAQATVSVNVDQKLPNTSTGMKVWIKADAQPLANNTSLSTTNNLIDSAASGANVTNNTNVGLFLTNVYNGKPIIRYDAALSCANPINVPGGFAFNTTTNTIIVVASTSSSSSGAIFSSTGFGSTPMLHANPFYWDNRTSTTVTDAIAMGASLPNSLNVLVITQTDSVLVQAFQNGVFMGEKVSVAPLNGRTISSIGGTGGFFYGGDLAEIILYNRVLTNAENYAIQCGLAKKWGITMANCQ